MNKLLAKALILNLFAIGWAACSHTVTETKPRDLAYTKPPDIEVGIFFR